MGTERPADTERVTAPPRRAASVRNTALVGLSLLDDVAIAALAHGRLGFAHGVVLGPKGMLVGGLLGLAAGASASSAAV